MLSLKEMKDARMVVEEVRHDLEAKLQSKIGYRDDPDGWCDITVEDYEKQYPEEVAQLKALDETIKILNAAYNERAGV